MLLKNLFFVCTRKDLISIKLNIAHNKMKLPPATILPIQIEKKLGKKNVAMLVTKYERADAGIMSSEIRIIGFARPNESLVLRFNIQTFKIAVTRKLIPMP